MTPEHVFEAITLANLREREGLALVDADVVPPDDEDEALEAAVLEWERQPLEGEEEMEEGGEEDEEEGEQGEENSEKEQEVAQKGEEERGEEGEGEV